MTFSWRTVGIAFILLTFPVWWPFLLESAGFYVDEPGWWTAERIVKKNGTVHDCEKTLIMPWNILSPSGPDQRASCIYHFAEITKSPAACEFLLPREYGLACISNTVTEAYEDRPNVGFFAYEECANIPENDARRDWCAYVTAHRERSTGPCISIVHPVVRKACIMKFEAWEKYPQLRDSSYFGRAAEPE